MTYPVVFWQPTLSIHQASLLRAFAERWAGNVWLIVNEGVSPERLQMGWPNELDYGKVKVVQSPSVGERRDFISSLPSDSVHVISGLGRDQLLRKTARMARQLGHATVHYLEPWDSRRKYRAVLLWFYYYVQAMRIGSRPFFLSTSLLGEKQLRSIGISENRIYSFGYFLDSSKTASAASQADKHDLTRLLFVGNISNLKQTAEVARIINRNPQLKLIFSVIGDGEDRIYIEQLASRDDRIRLLGSLDNEAVRQQMGQADYLILPSQYDGWGAVASEALIEGTPVLVSRNCGVSQTIRVEEAGLSFHPSTEEIQAALEYATQRGVTTLERRNALKKWSERSLTGAAGGRYLVEILNFERAGRRGARPAAPWVSNDILSG